MLWIPTGAVKDTRRLGAWALGRLTAGPLGRAFPNRAARRIRLPSLTLRASVRLSRDAHAARNTGPHPAVGSFSAHGRVGCRVRSRGDHHSGEHPRVGRTGVLEGARVGEGL